MDLLKGDFSQAAVCDGMTVYNSFSLGFGPVVGLHGVAAPASISLKVASGAMVGVGLLVVMMPILCARVPSRAWEAFPLMLLGLVLGVCTTAMVVARDSAVVVASVAAAAPIVGITFQEAWTCYFVLGSEASVCLILMLLTMCSSERFRPSAVGALCMAIFLYMFLGAIANLTPLIMAYVPSMPSVPSLGIADYIQNTYESQADMYVGGAAAFGALVGRRSTSTPSSMDSAFAVVGTALMAQGAVQLAMIYLDTALVTQAKVLDFAVAYTFAVYLLLNVIFGALKGKVQVDQTPGKTLMKKAQKVSPAKGGRPPSKPVGKRGMY